MIWFAVWVLGVVVSAFVWARILWNEALEKEQTKPDWEPILIFLVLGWPVVATVAGMYGTVLGVKWVLTEGTKPRKRLRELEGQRCDLRTRTDYVRRDL